MRMITIEMEKTKVYQGPITACIGYFDGVHLGHCLLYTSPSPRDS